MLRRPTHGRNFVSGKLRQVRGQQALLNLAGNLHVAPQVVTLSSHLYLADRSHDIAAHLHGHQRDRRGGHGQQRGHGEIHGFRMGADPVACCQKANHQAEIAQRPGRPDGDGARGIQLQRRQSDDHHDHGVARRHQQRVSVRIGGHIKGEHGDNGKQAFNHGRNRGQQTRHVFAVDIQAGQPAQHRGFVDDEGRHQHGDNRADALATGVGHQRARQSQE
jgi:hypothetical protein